MANRLDITSRNLYSGQNDSAAAERLEFPGLIRSWNVRGRRETARRRMGKVQASGGATTPDGMGAIHNATGANYFVLAQNPFVIREHMTIDWCFNVDADPYTRAIIGMSALGTYGLIRVYATAGTLTVEVPLTGAATQTFTQAGLTAGVTYYCRLAYGPKKVTFYINAATPQTYNASNTIWGTAANDTWLLNDYTLSNTDPCSLGWFRVFNISMFHRQGMDELYPRPRDRYVAVNYMHDIGEGFLTDGTTEYVQDFSSYQRHGAITGSLSAGVHLHRSAYCQFAGDMSGRGQANDRTLMLVDGDAVPGAIL